MFPHVACGGWTPRPRKLSDASVRMAPPIVVVGRQRHVGQYAWEYVQEQQPHVAGPDRPRRGDVVHLPQRQHLAAHEAALSGPAEHPYDGDDVEDIGA